jgi:cobalt-zinc-cadmium efflux system outer membrane protein
MRRLLLASCATLCSLALASGCASVQPEAGHEGVAKLVQERTGYKTRWEKGPPADEHIARWVEQLLGGGLSRDRAVEIALVNNPTLQALYEELGVSQADMVQAGLLPNPRIAGSVGFPLNGTSLVEYEASLAEDFLGIFLLPLRQRVARQRFMAETVRVAHQTMSVAAEAKRAFATLQAQSSLLELRRSLVEGAEAAADLAAKQHDAGNINDLTFTREQTFLEQARVDLARDELAVVEAREAVNRLLGLWGPRTGWTLAEELPDLPADDPLLEHLEARAVGHRLDIEASRIETELLWNAVELAKSSRFFGVVEVGAHVHQDPDGPRLVGPTLALELPIFDQRQALIARLEAQHRQAIHRLDALAIDARSEVRLVRARLEYARSIVTRYKTSVLPLRERAVEQSQLQYNGMQIGLFELVATKQAQIESYRAYIDAVRDYWAARADLELAVGGRIFPKGKS